MASGEVRGNVKNLHQTLDPLALARMPDCTHLDHVREIGMVIPDIRGETRIPPSPLGG
jgi:hypothetical protein